MVLLDKEPLASYITNLWSFDVEHDVENRAYRCLLGRVHVTNAAKVLMFLELIVMSLYLLFLFPWCLLWIGMHFIIIWCTLYALKKKKHRWMWPMVILAAIQFFVWCIVTVFKFFIGIFSTDYFLQLYGQGHHENPIVRILIVILIKSIVLIIGFILFWRLTVFLTTQKYFEVQTDAEIDLSDPQDASKIEKLLRPL